MSTKITSYVIPKSSADHRAQMRKGILLKTEKTRNNAPKRSLTSKKPTTACTESKSCSSGITVRCSVKPKKTTKSDSTVAKKIQYNVADYCRKCGDGKGNNNTRERRDNIESLLSAVNVTCVKNDNNVKKVTKKISKPVQQHYKNENFNQLLNEESAHDTNNNNKKVSLCTITEGSEKHIFSEDSFFNIFSDSEDDESYLDPNSDVNIEKLKEFRQKNYFECHSAKSRIKSRVSATSLTDHKCVYRFYLNERLFPVPLNTDYNNKVRCVECQLPMDIKQETSGDQINGTIQAKVKLSSGHAQDMLLLLPVKDSLIIEERRKGSKQKDEYVYFGVVKLTADGNSMFNRTLPDNSLALKYQKGYQEYQNNGRYNYKEIHEDDVIII